VGGTYVWTDYAYDDRGPDTDGIKGGDATYPPEADPGNAADVIQLQVGLTTQGAVTIKFVLNSLVDPSVPLVGVGFDTDADPATGSRGIPGGYWQVLGSLGLEAFVVISSEGGRLLRFVDGVWHQDGATFTATVDTEDNTVSTTVASSLLDPGAATWRAVGVAGIRRGGRSWLDGDGPIYDLAFVRAEDPFTESALAVFDAGMQVSGQAQAKGSGTREWQDHNQADIFVGRIDASNAVARIDFSKVGARMTEFAQAGPGGFETFLYHSRVRLGEGVQQNPRIYKGVYQPYLVRLAPPSVLQPGLVAFLHGGSENHLQSANYFAPSFSEFVSPGHFDPPAVVIFPLGRDEDWLPGPTEKDFLDSIEDAITRLGIDRDRVAVTGISAGGVGTLHYGQIYPDRFSGVYALAGGIPPGLLQNMSNIPVRTANGLADPALGTGNTVLTAPVLDQLGIVDYRVWLANIRSHVPMPGLGDCVLREFMQHARVVNPARVVYTYDARTDVVDPGIGLDLRRNGAYWVSEMAVRPAGPGGFSFPVLGQYVDVGADRAATMDVMSLARPDRVRSGTPTRTIHENATHGEDYCGPNPAVRSGDSWEESALRLQTAADQPVSNGMELSMTNVAEATLDLGRMSLSTGTPLAIHANGDGASSITLTGPWEGPVTVTKDGAAFATLDGEAQVVLSDDFSGEHVYVLTRAGP
jgi:predicted esterase